MEIDGETDGRTVGRTEERSDGRTDEQIYYKIKLNFNIFHFRGIGRGRLRASARTVQRNHGTKTERLQRTSKVDGQMKT